MKKCFLPYLVVIMTMFSLPAFSQSKTDTKASSPTDTASLGMAGDNLDLYAVMDLFLKSKTIEDFEKSLNNTKSGINNLDLDLDKKIDFIKVVTKKEGDSAYTFVLQDAVSKTETQDVAVILVNRDKNKKISVQIVGDEDLYGKNYVIEPKTQPTPAVTANPAYTGSEPAKDVPASTTTVVVQTAPIVQYVYSPAYVPYYPPYYYGYHPPYFAMATVIAVGIYRHNNWYHHGGYYGGHYHGGGNTVVINNRNQINHYNNSRNTSNRVQHNNASGNYGNGNRGGGPSASTRPSNGGASGNRPSNGPSASTRPANGGASSNRPSASNNMSSNRSGSAGNRSSGGFSGGSSRGGGGFSGGGGGRGGGGGGRRR